MIATTVKPMLEAEAKKRMVAGINQYSSPVEILPQGEKGKEREQIYQTFRNYYLKVQKSTTVDYCRAISESDARSIHPQLFYALDKGGRL